jgi:hypothetical protein
MNGAPFGRRQGLHRDGAFHDIRQMSKLLGRGEHHPQDLHESVHAVVPNAFDHDVAGVDVSRIVPVRQERWAQLAGEFPHHVVSDVSCAQGRQSLDGVEETRAVIKVQPGCVAYPARSFCMVTCHLRRLAHPSRYPRTGHVRDDTAIPQQASTMHGHRPCCRL